MLYNLIQKIATYYPAGPVRDRYVAAAKNFRIPYWDWAAVPAAGQSVLPQSVGGSPAVSVNGPSGTQTIANPLFSYLFKPLSTSDLPDMPVSLFSFRVSGKILISSMNSSDGGTEHCVTPHLQQLQVQPLETTW